MDAIHLSLNDIKAELLHSNDKHEGTLNALAIDGNCLYSIGSKGNLILWSKEALQMQDSISICEAGLESIAIDTNYLYLGSVLDDNSIRVFLKQGLKPIITLKDEYSPFLSLTTTSSEIVGGRANGYIDFWNKSDWTKVASIPSRHHIVLTVSVDNDYLFAGGIDDYISIFRLGSFEHVINLEGHEADIFSLATDSDFIYSGSGEVWWGGPGSPRPPSFESAIRVWKKESWECVMKLEGHTDNVNTLAVDDNTIYSVSDDGTLRAYNKSDWSMTVVDLESGPLRALALDYSSIYVGGNRGDIWKISKSVFKN